MLISGQRRCFAMSYIDEIRHIGRDANPFFRMMGIEVTSFGDGKAKLSMQVRPDMLNGVGWLQGGLYAAIADEAMALALFTLLSRDAIIATVSETTSYIRGVRDGRIIAIADVIRMGRKVAFVESDVLKEDDDTLLSRTTASFTIVS